MALPKFISTIQSKVLSGIKKAGQMVFTSDTQRLYWDIDENTRVEITDIIELQTEEERTSLLTPIDKFYYVHETNVLWRYHEGGWNQVIGDRGSSNKVIAFSQKIVPISSWEVWTTPEEYNGYGFRAAIDLNGVRNDMIPNIIFYPKDAALGIYAPTSDTYNGGVYIFASKIPLSEVVIAMIVVMEANN